MAMAAACINFLKNLLIPNGLLFLAILLIAHFSFLPHELLPYAGYYPYAIYLIAAILCWRFHKDRYLFAVLCIGASERILYFLIAGSGAVTRAGSLLQTCIGILLPLNLVLLELINDRGILTFRGILRWLLLTGEACLLGYIYLTPESYLAVSIHTHLTGLSSHLATIFLDPVSAAFLLALLILGLRFLFRQIQYESSTIWILVLLYLGIHHTKDMALLTYFPSFAALIFVAAILETSYRLAYYDELTGLPARRSLNEQLLRLGPKYTIAMVDIDFFKKFNDSYGHDVGDQVLKMVASKLQGVSGGGRAFRYGGEEFAIIFAGGTMERVRPCLEKLREHIAATNFTIRSMSRSIKQKKASKKKRPNKSVKITVSIGAAQKNNQLPDAQAVIKAADKALYRAKKAGRNRVSA